jgi:hypothetical protein
MTDGYIYAVWEREFQNTNREIYKVGCTGDMMQRLRKYPKGSHLIMCQRVPEYKRAEQMLFDTLNQDDQIVKCCQYGREYYMASEPRMTKVFIKVTRDAIKYLTPRDQQDELPAPKKTMNGGRDTSIVRSITDDVSQFLTTCVQSSPSSPGGEDYDISTEHIWDAYIHWCNSKYALIRLTRQPFIAHVAQYMLSHGFRYHDTWINPISRMMRLKVWTGCKLSDEIREIMGYVKHDGSSSSAELDLIHFLNATVQPSAAEDDSDAIKMMDMWRAYDEWCTRGDRRQPGIKMKRSDFNNEVAKYMLHCGYRYHDDTTVGRVRMFKVWRGCYLK